MKSFLIYNEEGIPIQSSLPVLAKDEYTMKLLSFGVLIGIVVIIAIAAFFMSIFIYSRSISQSR